MFFSRNIHSTCPLIPQPMFVGLHLKREPLNTSVSGQRDAPSSHTCHETRIPDAKREMPTSKSKQAPFARKRKRASNPKDGGGGERAKKVHWGSKSASSSTRSSRSEASARAARAEEEDASISEMESGRVEGEAEDEEGRTAASASAREGESEEEEPDAPGQICVSATCSGCVTLPTHSILLKLKPPLPIVDAGLLLRR